MYNDWYILCVLHLQYTVPPDDVQKVLETCRGY
jgi:hypothetical protein